MTDLLCRRCNAEPVPSAFTLCRSCREVLRYRAEMRRELDGYADAELAELERERAAELELELERARQMTLDELER